MAATVTISFQLGKQRGMIKVGEETYDILQDCSMVLNRPLSWFVSQTIERYGTLSEIDILKLIKLITRDWAPLEIETPNTAQEEAQP